MEDRIVLSLRTDSDLLKGAIAACGDYIAAETLATELTDCSLDSPAAATDVKITAHPLHVALRKA